MRLSSPVHPYSMNTLGNFAKKYPSPLANTDAMFETIAGFGLESFFIAPSAESEVPLVRTRDSVKLFSSIRCAHVRSAGPRFPPPLLPQSNASEFLAAMIYPVLSSSIGIVVGVVPLVLQTVICKPKMIWVPWTEHSKVFSL